MSKQLDLAVIVYTNHTKAVNESIVKLANDCLDGKCPPQEYLEEGLWDPFFENTGMDGVSYAKLLDDYGTEDGEVNFLIGVWITTLINADRHRFSTIIEQFKFFLSEGV